MRLGLLLLSAVVVALVAVPVAIGNSPTREFIPGVLLLTAVGSVLSQWQLGSEPISVGLVLLGRARIKAALVEAVVGDRLRNRLSTSTACFQPAASTS